METNQNHVQENSAQRIAHELEQPAERLYDPAKAARIVQCLTDGYFDPEYILLFGKLAGGPRSGYHARPDADAFDKADAGIRRQPYRKHFHAAMAETNFDENAV